MGLEMLLMNAIQVSLTASAVLLPLLLLRFALRKRYPARRMVLLWTLLAVRLLVPVQFVLPQAPVKVTPHTSYIQTLEKPQQGARAMEALAPPEEDDSAVPASEGHWQLSGASRESREADGVVIPIGMFLFLLWTAVALFLWCRAIWCMRRYRRQIMRYAEPVTAPDLLRAFEKETARIGRKRPVRLLCSGAACGPMLMGLFRPMLVLPNEAMAQADAELIFRHELTHWKRGDLWRKALLVTIRCMHWFNPLVWWMVRAAGEDMEFACDSEVVRDMDLAQKKRYGICILNNVEQQIHRRSELTTCFHSDKEGIKMRLSELFTGTQKKRGVGFLIAVLLTVAVTGASVMISQGDVSAVSEITEEQLIEYGNQWASARGRNAEIWYKMLTDDKAQKLKAEIENLNAQRDSTEFNWIVGVSSPQVYNWTVLPDTKTGSVTIISAWGTSASLETRKQERLVFEKEDGEWKVSRVDGNAYIEGGELSDRIDSVKQFLLFYNNDLGLPDVVSQMNDAAAQAAGQENIKLEDPFDAAAYELNLEGYTFDRTGGESPEGMVEAAIRFSDGSVYVTMAQYGEGTPWYPVDWRVDAEHPRTSVDLATQWARGLMHKDGHFLLPILTENQQEALIEHQRELAGEPDGTWYWKVGGSSPSKTDYVLAPNDDGSIRIVYQELDSSGVDYRTTHTLHFLTDKNGNNRISEATDAEESFYNIDSLAEFAAMYGDGPAVYRPDLESLQYWQENGEKQNLFDPFTAATGQTRTDNAGWSTYECLYHDDGSATVILIWDGTEKGTATFVLDQPYREQGNQSWLIRSLEIEITKEDTK